MAKFKLKIPTLDAVSEELRQFYVAHADGGFIIDYESSDGYGVDNLQALRGKLDAANTDLARQKKRLQDFAKDDGSLYTPEEIQALAADLTAKGTELETLRSKDKSAEEKLQERLGAAKRPLEQQIADLKKSADRYRKLAQDGHRERIKQTVLGQLKPKDEWADLISRDLDGRIEIKERDDGTFTHVFTDANGQALMSARQGQDGHMDGEEFAAGDYRKKFLSCLQGDGKRGAGVGGSVDNPPARPGGDDDIVLQEGHTQEQFEAAVTKSFETGQEVVMPEASE